MTVKELKGSVHCFFEQSGTFKNEFIKLGIHAFDYDIQDNFGQTDHVVDLFREIESAWEGQKSVFDSIGKEDLIMAFFPCTYFCSGSQVSMYWSNVHFEGLPYEERTRRVLERAGNRLRFFSLAIKMLTVAKTRGLRLIMENPWTSSYLSNGFVLPPSVIDNDRSLRGDFFVKPTAYWFINCEPTHGLTIQKDKKVKRVMNCKSATHAGLCSEDRSMISPDYARNFIHDFILYKAQRGTQLDLFDMTTTEI